MRVFLDLGKTVLKRRRPQRRARGEPVLVVPGFGTSDAATVVLRDYLSASGFDVHTWNLGINRGPRAGIMRRLSLRVRALARRTRQRVRIVGWSLGGLMARVIAGRLPRHVGSIVTLGSPLTADPHSSHLSRLYDWLGGTPLQTRNMKTMLRDGARAPVTSIFSRNDGVVAWKASAEGPGTCRCLEVDASHLSLIIDPVVLDLVAREVAREPLPRHAASSRTPAGR